MLTKGVERAVNRDKQKGVFGNDKLLGSLSTMQYVAHLSSQHPAMLNYGRPTRFNLQKYRSVEQLGFVPPPRAAVNMGAGFFVTDPMTEYDPVRPHTINTADRDRASWDYGTASSANRIGLNRLYEF